jgi:hypothetical protein
MTGLFFVVVQLVFIGCIAHRLKRTGNWSWLLFFLTIAFLGLEVAIVLVPAFFLDYHTRYYLPVIITCGVIDALNFIWFLIIARRWKFPAAQTSLQADSDHQQTR